MIIDFHTHVFPDELAPRALALAIERVPGHAQPCFDGTAQGLQAVMTQSGVDLAIVQPVATKPGQVMAINRWAKELYGLKKVRAFGALHPAMNPDEVQIAMDGVAAAGLCGVKMHPEYQAFFPDEDRMEIFYAGLQQRGLVLLLHAGKDLAFPGEVKATPQRLLSVARAFPRLKLVLAHFGGFRMWDEVERTLIGQPVWLDTAYCAQELAPARLLELARAHGIGRVLLASDAPWGNLAGHLAYIRSAGFSLAELQAITGGNAQGILKEGNHAES